MNITSGGGPKHAGAQNCNGFCHIQGQLFTLQLNHIPSIGVCSSSFSSHHVKHTTFHRNNVGLIWHINPYIRCFRRAGILFRLYPSSRTSSYIQFPTPDPRCLVTCDKYSSPQKFHIASLFPIGFQIIVLAESHSIVCGGENHVYCTCYLTVRCGHKVGDKPNHFIILVYNIMILTAIR